MYSHHSFVPSRRLVAVAAAPAVVTVVVVVVVVVVVAATAVVAAAVAAIVDNAAPVPDLPLLAVAGPSTLASPCTAACYDLRCGSLEVRDHAPNRGRGRRRRRRRTKRKRRAQDVGRPCPSVHHYYEAS